MDLDPYIPIPAPWAANDQQHYFHSPTNFTNCPTSPSGSGFSIEAPSSRSSISTDSSTYSGQDWVRDLSLDISQRQTLNETNASKENIRPRPCEDCPAKHELPPPEQRQHPRRTQRLNKVESQNGVIISSALPPPALVRQSERKVNFVDSLVDTTTQMVETIWPLSTYATACASKGWLRQPSKMPLRQFIQEVLRRSKTSYSTLQVALYYLILIRPRLPCLDFTQEQPEESESLYSLQCGRRMFIAALISASKYLQDRNFSTNAWSRISGLSVWDLNVNEKAFLNTLQWKLHVPGPLWHRWVDIVLTHSPAAQGKYHPWSPAPRLPWKEIVLRLTPQLLDSDFGNAELSDDSGYNSPGSDMSPPSLPVRDDVLSDEVTPTPATIPRWLNSTPERVPSTVQQRPTLPPLPPYLAPLPTPDFTPQTVLSGTPAANTVRTFSGRPSMSHAMSQIDESSWKRCTLDSVAEWKSKASQILPPIRRSSLATSASSTSSPESMSDASTQLSDFSARPSRSSSISSVASSICAPVQSTKLAIQATRRCANMHVNGLAETAQLINPTMCSQASSCFGCLDKTEANAPHTTTSRGMQVPMHRIFSGNESCSLQPDVSESPAETRSEDLGVVITGNSPPTPPTFRPHPSSRPIHSTSAQRDVEAAAALHELRLNRPQPVAHPKPHPEEHASLRTVCNESRKRPRPKSVDLSADPSADVSVEGAVRPLIAPRCLGDITNMRKRNEEDRTVIPDDRVADSFLLRKENRHAVREAHKRPTKAVKTKAAGGGNGNGEREVLGEKTSRGNAVTRKKTCAGSDRGGRDEVRKMVCLR